MKLLDTFAGIGGFSLAAHWCGWSTAAFVERDKFCQQVLKKNFGSEIPIYDDIKNFDGTQFRGQIDIITGGFPCQPFSQAGERKGTNDDRYLFPEMLRVIREVRPRWVVAENVRGLLSIENGEVFAEILTSLEAEGYKVGPCCVPASAVEAPHERMRVWIIAHDVANNNNKGLSSGRREGERGRQELGRYDRHTADATVHAERSGRPGSPCGSATVTTRHWEEDRLPQPSDRYGSHTSSLGRREEYSDSGRCEERVREERNGSRSGIGIDVRVAGVGNAGLQRCELSGTSGEVSRSPRPATKRFADASWFEAAASLCRMDDGVSDELDVVGSRDNRVQRLKALGNSIVPTIAYEIFRSIQEAEATL